MQINFSQSNITVAELTDLAQRHHECIISNGRKGYKVVPAGAAHCVHPIGVEFLGPHSQQYG